MQECITVVMAKFILFGETVQLLVTVMIMNLVKAFFITVRKHKHALAQDELLDT